MPKNAWVVKSSNSKTGQTDSKKHPRSSHWEMRRKDGDIFYVKKDGYIVKVPSSGPDNTLIRSGSIFPFPKEEASQ
jgi:hypothetical protein